MHNECKESLPHIAFYMFLTSVGFFSFFLDKSKRKATFRFHIILFKGRKYRRKIIFANQYWRHIETSTDKTLNECNLN